MNYLLSASHAVKFAEVTPRTDQNGSEKYMRYQAGKLNTRHMGWMCAFAGRGCKGIAKQTTYTLQFFFQFGSCSSFQLGLARVTQLFMFGFGHGNYFLAICTNPGNCLIVPLLDKPFGARVSKSEAFQG